MLVLYFAQMKELVMLSSCRHCAHCGAKMYRHATIQDDQRICPLIPAMPVRSLSKHIANKRKLEGFNNV